MEGGANEGGKGKSIWDTFTSQPGNIDDGSSGEVEDSELCCNVLYCMVLHCMPVEKLVLNLIGGL